MIIDKEMSDCFEFISFLFEYSVLVTITRMNELVSTGSWSSEQRIPAAEGKSSVSQPTRPTSKSGSNREKNKKSDKSKTSDKSRASQQKSVQKSQQKSSKASPGLSPPKSKQLSTTAKTTEKATEPSDVRTGTSPSRFSNFSA